MRPGKIGRILLDEDGEPGARRVCPSSGARPREASAMWRTLPGISGRKFSCADDLTRGNLQRSGPALAG
jgi:hypothetical protein